MSDERPWCPTCGKMGHDEKGAFMQAEVAAGVTKAFVQFCVDITEVEVGKDRMPKTREGMNVVALAVWDMLHDVEDNVIADIPLGVDLGWGEKING